MNLVLCYSLEPEQTGAHKIVRRICSVGEFNLHLTITLSLSKCLLVTMDIVCLFFFNLPVLLLLVRLLHITQVYVHAYCYSACFFLLLSLSLSSTSATEKRADDLSLFVKKFRNCLATFQDRDESGQQKHMEEVIIFFNTVLQCKPATQTHTLRMHALCTGYITTNTSLT